MKRRTLALILSMAALSFPASAYAQSGAASAGGTTGQPNGPQKLISDDTVPAAQFLDVKKPKPPPPSPRPGAGDDTVPAAQFLEGKAPPPAPKPAVTAKQAPVKPKPVP